MEEQKENVHAGHRQRVRKRFAEHGFLGMEDHQILEMVLYYAIPRKDTNLIAHRLINRYGSFSKVCDAPIDILKSDFALSESAAVLLKMIPELSKVYSESKLALRYIDKSTAVEILRPKFIGASSEKIALALSDANDKLIFCDVVSEGSLAATEMPVRRIVDAALRSNAKYAYLAHNHPSELCVPSRCDLDMTRVISATLVSIGVKLVDHIIFTSTEFFSIRSYKHFEPYFN